MFTDLIPITVYTCSIIACDASAVYLKRAYLPLHPIL